MGHAESIPVVSQVISAGQAISGDLEGAQRTQEHFSRTCPVVSQGRSLVEVSCGDHEAALRTQMVFAAAANDAVDRSPGLGHVKAEIHKACEDDAGACKARDSANAGASLAAGGSIAASFLVGHATGSASAAAIAGALGGSAALLAPSAGGGSLNRFAWSIKVNQDADHGQNIEILHTSDFEFCYRRAEEKGYGGFAVWNNTVFFRAASGPELLQRLQDGDGVDFHIYVPHPSRHSFVRAPVQQQGPIHRSVSAPPAHQQELMNPLVIRFTQDSIDADFRHGTHSGQRLDATIDAMLQDEANPDDIPMITVVRHDGHVFSLDNRRLFVFRVLAMRRGLSQVPVRIVPKSSVNWEAKFTTQNDGATIRVRGDGSRYQVDANFAPPRRVNGRARQRIASARNRRNDISPEPQYDYRVS